MANRRKFTYKRKFNKKPKKNISLKSKTAKTMIRKVVRDTLEPKLFYTPSNAIANVLHRDFYYFTPISPIAAGVGESNRTGSEVWVKGISLKIMANRNVNFFDDIRMRITAFWNPNNEIDTSEVASTTWATATVVRDALFQTEGQGLETIIREQYGIKPIYDKSFIFKTDNTGALQSTVRRTAKPMDIYIPCNFKFKWRNIANTTIPVKQFFITAYFYGGGLVPADLNTLITGFNSTYKVYYRDV